MNNILIYGCTHILYLIKFQMSSSILTNLLDVEYSLESKYLMWSIIQD